MTTINTIQDLLDILDGNPSRREAVRARIVGEDLMQLPARFDAFVTRVEAFIAWVEAFIARQEAFNAWVEAFIAEQKEFNARVEAFMAQQEAFNARVEAFIARVETFMTEQKVFNARVEAFMTEQKEFNARVETFMREQSRISANAEARMNRMESDISNIKDGHIRVEFGRMIYDMIEDMGYNSTEILSPTDLVLMARRIPNATRNELRSFRLADMVALATNPANGEPVYIAAEASWTGNEYDVTRAQRNARFLTEVTGIPAIPVVASVRNTREAQVIIDAGAIQWHRIDPSDARPE